MIKYLLHFVKDEEHDFYIGVANSNYPYSVNCPWFARGKSRKFKDLADYAEHCGYKTEAAAKKAVGQWQPYHGDSVVVAVEVA